MAFSSYSLSTNQLFKAIQSNDLNYFFQNWRVLMPRQDGNVIFPAAVMELDVPWGGEAESLSVGYI
ncbi:hypothetical protein BBH88_18470 [Planococcus antarcticus DSM 14505]|uniref:Uncharacterized protein n=1 Tax=Planococcus antarcticus DSM 14505 TaxID=1185653 RepID=A0ABM6D9I1_9BACL|nr:hypothetical protein BBH88_18470 [Planococcus antarcticus DSM 14505]